MNQFEFDIKMFSELPMYPLILLCFVLKQMFVSYRLLHSTLEVNTCTRFTDAVVGILRETLISITEPDIDLTPLTAWDTF